MAIRDVLLARTGVLKHRLNSGSIRKLVLISHCLLLLLRVFHSLPEHLRCPSRAAWLRTYRKALEWPPLVHTPPRVPRIARLFGLINSVMSAPAHMHQPRPRPQ